MAGKIKTNDEIAKVVVGAYQRARDYKNETRVQGAPPAEWSRRMYRAYNKVHEPTELAQWPHMGGYFGLIQLKVNATYGWMRNLTMGYQDSPVVLSPTEVVELPDSLNKIGQQIFKNKILAKLQEAGIAPQELINPKTGALWPQIKQQIDAIALAEKGVQRRIAYGLAKTALERHEKVILDQLVEGGWRIAYARTVFDALLYPCGVMAFGEYRNSPVFSWKGNKSKRIMKEIPRWRNVPFSLSFLAPDAESANDGEFFIELVPFSRQQLIDLRAEENAVAGEIDALLDRQTPTNCCWLTPEERDDPLTDSNQIMAIKYSGYISGKEIADLGVEIDRNKQLNVTVFVVAGRTIWIDLESDELAGRNYASVSYTGNGYGTSIGMMLWDRQKRLNRLEFFQAVNEANAFGPAIEYNESRFSHPKDANFKPWSAIATNGDNGAGNQSAIKFHIAPALWQQLFSQFQQHLRLSDDECGIPAFAAYGTQGGSPTLGQDVIRFNAAQKGLQSFGLNIDEYLIEPVFQTLYHDNLQYLDDDSIKSDATIKPRGITARMNQEMQKAAVQNNLPSLMSLAQQNLVPPDMVKAAARQYLEGMGLPVEEYMPDRAGELNMEQYQTMQPGIPSPTADGRSPGSNI